MSVLKIKDGFGNWVSVPGIKGEDGEPGATAAHAARHAKGGTDEITPESIGAARAEHSHTPADIGAAPAGHTHDPASIGAVNKNGDTVNGNLTVVGAHSVKRSDSARHARTVVHGTEDVDLQNYGDDNNYVAVRVTKETTDAGNAAKLAYMKNGSYAEFPLLHTGNKEKIFTFGTDDLTAGSSSLGTGQLHFVYE